MGSLNQACVVLVLTALIDTRLKLILACLCFIKSLDFSQKASGYQVVAVWQETFCLSFGGFSSDIHFVHIPV